MTISVDPVLVHLGPIALSWYGIVIVLAIGVGVTLAMRLARPLAIPQPALESVAIWALVGGIAGARLLHVIDRWELYAATPIHAIAIWNGGLAIVGAVLGGTLAGAIAAIRAGVPVRPLADAVAPAVILAQAIGRGACLFTGDAVGAPTRGFGVTYTHPGAMVPQLGVAYEPVFLYEAAWDLVVFGVLMALRGRLATGLLFAGYLFLYGAGKFAVTTLRVEKVWLAGLQEAQLLALAAMALGLLWAAWPSVAFPRYVQQR